MGIHKQGNVYGKIGEQNKRRQKHQEDQKKRGGQGEIPRVLSVSPAAVKISDQYGSDKKQYVCGNKIMSKDPAVGIIAAQDQQKSQKKASYLPVDQSPSMASVFFVFP